MDNLGNFYARSGARYSHYADRRARVDSFVGWPRDRGQRPAELANAGLFYTGKAYVLIIRNIDSACLGVCEQTDAREISKGDNRCGINARVQWMLTRDRLMITVQYVMPQNSS